MAALDEAQVEHLLANGSEAVVSNDVVSNTGGAWAGDDVEAIGRGSEMAGLKGSPVQAVTGRVYTKPTS